MKPRRHFLVALCVGLTFAAVGVPCSIAADGPVASTASIAPADLQEDFPGMCLDKDGTPWVAYVEYDGKADTLQVAKRSGSGLTVVGKMAGPGIIHRPAIACDGKGTIWVVWSEVDAKNVMNLHARQATKADSEVVTLAASSGGDVFADAGTDRQGRVWVAWQSFNKDAADIFTRYFDPARGAWSEPIRVTTDAAGDWEPRLAFGAKDEAVIAFDSSRSDCFNVYLAAVKPDGATRVTQLSSSPRYQGRPSIAATPDGKGFWVAWENGRLNWGKNTRGVGGGGGLNANKHIDVVYYDAATGKVTPAANVRPVLARPAAAAVAKAPKKPAKKPAPRAKRPGAPVAVNLPEIVVDNDGNPWVAIRCYRGTFWNIAVTKYDAKKEVWSVATVLPNSTFSQDRRCQSARDADGRLHLAWASDLRTSKTARICGVYLSQIDPSAALAASPVGSSEPRVALTAPPKVVPRYGDDTPERARDDRHTWKAGEKQFSLYWGDFHRHTDISNCRTPDDGCIVEQFRYAYDVSKLDFLGTSDHTDVGKPYDAYEWWCNQKLADVFQSPDYFTSFYVYEREQRWPWGHRNVIFTERGGPLVYIKRGLYKTSPWQKTLPLADGAAEISPEELWKVLREHGRPVTVISHTGATGMGTDWDGYKQIDNAVENLVEIYQGARVSYEGINTPQPLVGFPRDGKLKPDAHGSVKTGKDFGQYNKGVYQNCLQNGYKLGVFANSDHISTHTTFGGVYAESFTRDGIMEGLNARRTIAATDKIFLEFACNGELLGTVFETSEKPALTVKVSGTAPLLRVTIVRNETDYKTFTPKSMEFAETFTDPSPIVGENRYYVRVEQTDGNMAWASPVWVTFVKNSK